MTKNVFGIVLAGGKGSRMGNTDKPKQYLKVGGKPIIIHTIDKFLLSNEFDAVLVVVAKQWVQYTKDLVKKHINQSEKLHIIEGGKERNDTLNNGLNYIKKNYQTDENTVVVTHDSVRPFINHRIISENIKAVLKYGCCDTVIGASDTIVISEDNEFITEIPNRDKMYQGQTPQSFKISAFDAVYSKMTEEEKAVLTDACKIFSLKGEKVALVEGDVTNFKITYAFDLKVAEAFLIN